MAEGANNQEGRGNSTKLVIGIVALVVVVIVGWSLIGYPPKHDNVEGTIGTAEKYRTEQVTTADVKLDSPEMQAILQNDKVLALLKNEHFKEAIKDKNFKQALFESSTFRSAAGNELVTVVSDKMMRDFATGPGFDVLVQKDLLKYILGPEVARRIASDEFQTVVNSQVLAKVNGPEALALAMQSPELVKMVQDVALRSFVEKAEVQQMLADPMLRATLSGAPTIAVISDEVMRSRLANPEIYQVIADPALRNAAVQPEVVQMLADPLLREALASPDVSVALDKSYFQQALASNDFWQGLAVKGI